MINLFFVVHDYSGVRTYADELLGYIEAQKGIIVHKIYIESCYYKEYTEIEEGNIKNIHIPEVERRWNTLKKYSSRCIDLMTPILQGKKNIIFHLNNRNHENLGIEARNRFGARIIYTLHFLPNYFSYLAAKSQLPDNFTITSDILEKQINKEADHVICVTHFAKESILKWFNVSENNVTVIHNGTGLTKHYKTLTLEQKEVIKKSFGFAKEEQIILFVGKVERRKGVKHLIAVFNKLAKTIPNIRLVIIGDGEHKEVFNYAKGNWGRITLTGKITKQEVIQFYYISSIGIIPSVFEQCSYVALEMMQFGLPVVVANAPGLNELFIDHKNALIAPLSSYNSVLLELEVVEEELEKLMEKLLVDEKLRKDIGKNAHRYWENGYAANYMGAETLKIYNQLCIPQDKFKLS